MTEAVRAVFMGSDRFSLPVLTALLTHGPALQRPVQVVGVVTQPDRPAGRGRQEAAGPVKVVAQRADLPVLQPARVRNAASVEEILDLKPDLLVVASFGQILPVRLIHAPPCGALNLHPSLLPRFRGPSPVAGAILAGETVTGTSLMVMVEQMDAGPVVSQVTVPIEPEETAGELTARLAVLSGDLLVRDLPAWLAGDLQPQPQEEAAATYTRLIRKGDGLIDWTLPAEEIALRVRAFNPWPAAFTYWGERMLRVLGAIPRPGESAPGAVAATGGRLFVGTGAGPLELTTVQLAGGRPVDARSFLSGHSEIVGAVLGSGQC